MIIQKTRIRNVEKYIKHVADSENFAIGVPVTENNMPIIQKIGFLKDLKDGQQILPKSIGNISNFNAYGKFHKLKDEPMETAYSQREWFWKDWGGHQHSKIVDVPYKRYPREFIQPPSEELRVVSTASNQLIVSRLVVKNSSFYDDIKHIVNLFLEIFGECIILDENLNDIEIPKIEKLNWEVLPPGEYPWDEVKNHVKESVSKAPKGKKPVIEHRLKIITKHNPTYFAVGKGGFDGYWVFGFPEKGIYILENSNYGNATYCFGDNWKQCTQLSKKEILDNELHFDRVVHREGWEKGINDLVSETRKNKKVV